MASQDTAWSGRDRLRRVRARRPPRAMDMLQGVVAIFRDAVTSLAMAKGVAILDVTGWGWATLIWGVLLILAGFGLLNAAGWARWLAIIGVSLNAIGQIAFMANYPQAYPIPKSC